VVPDTADTGTLEVKLIDWSAGDTTIEKLAEFTEA
jgi:hypothetical protein